MLLPLPLTQMDGVAPRNRDARTTALEPRNSSFQTLHKTGHDTRLTMKGVSTGTDNFAINRQPLMGKPHHGLDILTGKGGSCPLAYLGPPAA